MSRGQLGWSEIAGIPDQFGRAGNRPADFDSRLGFSFAKHAQDEAGRGFVVLIDTQRELAGSLLPGERVLWAGRPKQGLLLVGSDAFVIPFSLVWTGGVATGLAHSKSGPMFFVPVFMLVAGLYFVVGRFIHDAWLRSRTHYAITDRRILIWRKGPWGSFKALDRASMGTVELSGSRERGTIRFGQQAGSQWNRNNSLPALDPRPQFLAIADAGAVFDLLQRPLASGR